MIRSKCNFFSRNRDNYKQGRLLENFEENPLSASFDYECPLITKV